MQDMERETPMLTSTTPRRLAAISAACLLSIALPISATVAKEKTKRPAPPQALEVDYSVSIPNVDTVGSSLSDAALIDILSGNVAAHADGLATLDADSITVPEITINVTSTSADGPEEATVTLRGLALNDVVDGTAGAVSLEGMNLVAEDVSFDLGSLSASNLDIGGILGVYGLVDTGGQTELEVIYTDFVSTGGTLQSEEVACTIGGVNGAEFKARPLNTSFAEMVAIGQAMEDNPDTVDPALMGKFLKMYADILTAFETSEVTFDGMSCDGTDDDGRAMNFSIAGMSMGGMSPGIYPAISMDGLNIAVEDDGTMVLENLTIKPMDLSTTIATLQNAPDAVDETWLEANARALIPAMEGISVTGFDMDIPDPETEGGRIQATIGAFDLSLASYFNGIPTDFDISADNIQAEIPADSGDEAFEQLRALGLTDIDASFRLAAAWDEATDTIAIEEVSMIGVDLASVVLAGTITNATEDLFALDMNQAAMAGMNLAVKALDLNVTDAGLAELILAMVAEDQGADPASLRPVFAGLAQGTVISMMAGAADAAKLGEAVNAFVSGTAKTLNIGIVSKTDPGLGMMDFMEAESDPTSLIGKVNITATAK